MKRILSPAAVLVCLAPACPGQAAAEETAGAEIVVVGARRDLLHVPGSAATIEREDLERARVFTLNEALRQAPGLHPRDEEGLGLRPNIGVRGLSPTRSTKVLLLEDGLPLTYAPYGDNASYSHPPVRRFERIEVLKGAGQIRFGPNTVGGVVNYITPPAPSAPEAALLIAGGERGYGEVDVSGGGEALGARLYGHFNTTEFDGVRANHALRLNDLYLKAEREFGPGHAVSARFGYATEDSQVSYSGLTESEFRADPRGNPFPNDRFELERATASVTHAWTMSPTATLRTSAYTLWFDRDWFRQSSNSAQRPNDASDPACGGMANLSTTCGNEGRLREYNVYGLETRLSWTSAIAGVPLELETGARYHTERQNRLQINGDTPRARTPGSGRNGGVRELNLRYADAVSGFVAGRARLGRITVSPGVRVEQIDYERIDRLSGRSGRSDLTTVIAGLGATFDVAERVALYAGVHEGFAPPRVEDLIDGGGGAVDLDAERSLNWELGLRGSPAPGLDLDVAGFLLEFDNQIVPASLAGGAGATLTSAGETRHVGAEASARGSLKEAGLWTANDVFFRMALTWVATAEYEGARTSAITPGVSVSGNRLPYAPEWLASAALGVSRGDWLTAQVEVQHTGEQFTDDLNTVAPVANGQRGLIPEATIFNLAANLTPGGGQTTFFVTVKNVADKLYIVDRSRGVLPGAPRLVQGGIAVRF